MCKRMAKVYFARISFPVVGVLIPKHSYTRLSIAQRMKFQSFYNYTAGSRYHSIPSVTFRMLATPCAMLLYPTISRPSRAYENLQEGNGGDGAKPQHFGDGTISWSSGVLLRARCGQEIRIRHGVS
jgi:hypothetical protein